MSAPLKLPVLKSRDAYFDAALAKLLQRDVDQQAHNDKIERSVQDIIRQVREGGDQALLQLTQHFDGFDAPQLGVEVSAAQIKEAADNIATEQHQALQYAADRIRTFHQRQLQESWQYTEDDGTTLGQKVTPIQRAGLYVPGGKAAYPSSVLMNAIPAKVAGVEELIMVSPTPNGELNEVVLAAAHIAGVDRVLRIGGAQAIAALAYGTESIAPVDKVTGPGSIWVATAKQQVFGKVGIDMLAGPSEVLVIADETANPDWVAMDLFAQAEHDENAQSILLTSSEQFATQVQQSIDKLLSTQDRQQIIATSMANNSAIIIAENDQELVQIADTIAAEHLEIITENAEQLAQQVSHAGAIFIGSYSAESMGDYCAGPNHVLPTSGTARFSSPLGVYDFQKRSSIMQISAQGAQTIGKNAAILARSEKLMAHAQSAEYRLKD